MDSMLAGLVINGEVRIAEKPFDEIPKRDVVCWSTMIMGMFIHSTLESWRFPITIPIRMALVDIYAKGGCIEQTITLYPLLYLMVDGYGIQPEMECYGCMIELLVHACLIDEAVQLIASMEVMPDPAL
ncbi:hypothetical protein VNO77_43404 [Canavalia gladiata]|uniref:Pentatricopeptide repeat-containing protein n=1 Tax=Canavalia gladiata TaxID=3824 RepID=A0AAN9JUQ6_CANGL